MCCIFDIFAISLEGLKFASNYFENHFLTRLQKILNTIFSILQPSFPCPSWTPFSIARVTKEISPISFIVTHFMKFKFSMMIIVAFSIKPILIVPFAVEPFSIITVLIVTLKMGTRFLSHVFFIPNEF